MPNSTTAFPQCQYRHIDNRLYDGQHQNVEKIESASREASEPQAHLGNTTVKSDSQSSRRVNNAVQKQDFLTAAKELLPDENRLQACLVATKDKHSQIWLKYDTDKNKAKWDNICRCDYGFICPNCGPIKGEKTRVVIREDLTVWGEAGFTSCSVVLTGQHRKHEALADTDGRMDKAFKKMFDSKAGREFKKKWCYAGFQRNPDYTYGENGHHSHRNYIFYLERWLLSDDEVREFEQELKSLWQHALELAGGYADLEHGCKVRFGDIFDVADYIASKAAGCGGQQIDQSGQADGWSTAEEFTLGQYKKGQGLTVTDLLRVYLLDDHPMVSRRKAAKLFQEYAAVFKGKQFLYTSPGFRARLNELKEQFKDELAEKMADETTPKWDRYIASPSREAWKQIVKMMLQLWALAELTNENGDVVYIKEFFEGHGITDIYYPDLDDSEEANLLREFNDFVKDWNSQPWPVK